MEGSLLDRLILAIWLAWLTVVTVAGEMGGDWLLHYMAKPCIMLSLVIYVALFVPYRPGQSWLYAALALGCIGDVLVIPRGADLLVPGLVFYLGMHGCYIRLFWHNIRQSGQPVRPGRFLVGTVLIVLTTGATLAYLYPHFMANPLIKPLWPGIVVFGTFSCALSLSGMVWQQMLRAGQFPLVLVGTLLLMACSMVMGYARFVANFSWAILILMLLYTAAHFCMVTGYGAVAAVTNEPLPDDKLTAA